MNSGHSRVSIYRENDMYIAECPEVGTVESGKTIELAVTELKEVTQCYLEEFPLLNRP